MHGDALKAFAATALAGGEPTEAETRAALADGIDVLLSFGSLGERMTVALEKIAKGHDIIVSDAGIETAPRP